MPPLLLLLLLLLPPAARVNALAWDAEYSVLYVGGSFDALGNETLTSGLAMWTKRSGLLDFPGGGAFHSDGGTSNTQVKAIAFEPRSEVSEFDLLSFNLRITFFYSLTVLSYYYFLIYTLHM